MTLVHDQADITAGLGIDFTIAIDHEEPIVVLSGLHAGCYELFVNDQIHTVHDLKDNRVAVIGMGAGEHAFLASVVAFIGLDPERDIEWVVANPNDWARLLVDGEVDVIVAFPPMNYDLHAKKIGHVILSTITDEPWRHYFCCMVAARREFVQNYPIASKRALRAILKANQLCSLKPKRTAQWLVDRGYAASYDYALYTLQDVPYKAWQDYDPDDTLRFYALEAGLITSAPHASSPGVRTGVF
jgi:NitT/TauT family transport system substrate-binding protein